MERDALSGGDTPLPSLPPTHSTGPFPTALGPHRWFRTHPSVDMAQPLQPLASSPVPSAASSKAAQLGPGQEGYLPTYEQKLLPGQCFCPAGRWPCKVRLKDPLTGDPRSCPRQFP